MKEFLETEFLGFRYVDYIFILCGFVIVFFGGWLNKKYFRWENESLFIRVFIALLGALIIALLLYVF